MTWGWQDVLTCAAVLAAVAYLVRITWRATARRAGAGSCATGGCGSCPGGATAGPPTSDGPGQVIPLDALTRHPPRR